MSVGVLFMHPSASKHCPASQITYYIVLENSAVFPILEEL